MAKTGLTYEMLCEEVLAQLIGKRGADLLAKETDRTVVGKIKEWISQYWKTVAGAIGLRDITELEASAMTIGRGKGPSKFLPNCVRRLVWPV